MLPEQIAQSGYQTDTPDVSLRDGSPKKVSEPQMSGSGCIHAGRLTWMSARFPLRRYTHKWVLSVRVKADFCRESSSGIQDGEPNSKLNLRVGLLAKPAFG